MSNMSGKVALITGASSGIGRATAEAFAAKGVKVALAARREDQLAKLAAEIKARGGAVTFVKTDVSVAKEVECMVAHTIETFGRLDYAVNNAGVEGQFAAITDLAEEDWDQILDINLKGTYLGMKYQARSMLACGNGGAIVASKHGLIGLTTSVSAELAPQGIRVNLVCPGFIDTPMHRRLRGIVGDQLYDEAIIPSVHAKRAGRPEEIAQSILFLCSDEASYITGTTLTPDGGYTLTM